MRETVGLGELSQIEDTDLVGAALGRAGAEDVPARAPLGLETQLGKDWQGGVELSGGAGASDDAIGPAPAGPGRADCKPERTDRVRAVRAVYRRGARSRSA